MLFVLSPAKSLDYETPAPDHTLAAATAPAFMRRAAELIDVLRAHTPAQIAELMSLSAPLADLNVARYKAWCGRATVRNSKPAVLAFNGDVYGGLQAPTLSLADLRWAQQHVAILSGLYGVLRPLDLLQPYRLEMGTRLLTAYGKDLYAYWGNTLAEHLNARAEAHAYPVIVNLASQEYFRAASSKVLRPQVLECVFEDWKNGRYKVISFFAKRARGLMVRYAITKRIVAPDCLKRFDVESYGFDANVSEANRFVFRRRLAE